MQRLPLSWLYLDLNSYFASVEQQINPKLRGRPVAVVPVESDTTCAIAASYEAKRFGVKTGTKIFDAKRMCPGLICVQARHENYIEYHHKVIKEVERHIPISVVASIDEVACKLMDNEAPPEVALKIAQNIKKGIATNVGECLRSSIGIASSKYIAKVATELEKPNGLVIVNSDELPHRLLGLKLRDLPGVGHSMEQRLHMHGIADIETLFKFSPKQLRKIWHSVWGEKIWYMLRGIDIPDIETTKSTVGHSHVMSPELRDPKLAILVAKRLTVKAASRMRRLGYYAEKFSFSAKLENYSYWGMDMKCIRAQDNMTFLHMLYEIWKIMLSEIGREKIKKLSVTLHGLTPERDVLANPFLFDCPNADEINRRERSLKISLAMDKLNHKFGRDSISIGLLPNQGRSFSGTKIAFTRIPDIQEFRE